MCHLSREYEYLVLFGHRKSYHGDIFNWAGRLCILLRKLIYLFIIIYVEFKTHFKKLFFLVYLSFLGDNNFLDIPEKIQSNVKPCGMRYM